MDKGKLYGGHLDEIYNEVFGVLESRQRGRKNKEGVESIGDTDIDPRVFEEEDYVLAILPPKEKEIYRALKNRFLEDFELNESSDEILLQTLILDEITRLKLIKLKIANPDNGEIDKLIENCVARIQRSMEALGVLRKQRAGKKEGSSGSLAELIQQFDKEKLLEVRKEYEEEEKYLFKEKDERDSYMSGDYEKAIELFEQKFGQIKGE